MPPDIHAYLQHISAATTSVLLNQKSYALYYQAALASARTTLNAGFVFLAAAAVSVVLGFLLGKLYGYQDNHGDAKAGPWICFGVSFLFLLIGAILIQNGNYGLHYPQIWATNSVVTDATTVLQVGP